jgi:hypothetical protein
MYPSWFPRELQFITVSPTFDYEVRCRLQSLVLPRQREKASIYTSYIDSF